MVVNRMIGNVGIVLDLLLVLHFCWWIVEGRDKRGFW